MEQATTGAGRKRKNRFGEMQLDSSSIQLKSQRVDEVGLESSASLANSENSACESASSDHALASCCSSNGSSDLAKWSSKFVDLEDCEVTPELFATSVGDSAFSCISRIQMTTSPEAGELGSCHNQPPSEAELEEFFSLAEQNLQKEFMGKYNFDIVKDEPLEGRYEWVKIK